MVIRDSENLYRVRKIIQNKIKLKNQRKNKKNKIFKLSTQVRNYTSYLIN